MSRSIRRRTPRLGHPGWLRRAAATLGVVALAASGAGCSAASPLSTGSTATPRVVVAFYPFQFLAERILGDRGRVENLTQPGAEPHDLELTAKQVTALIDADLVLYQRGFQPAVDEAVAQNAPRNALDLATAATGLLEGESADDHADHAEAYDPHTWLDPRLMVTFAESVRDRLTEVDPGNAGAYAANTRALVSDLESLDSEFAAGLQRCSIREFITTHAAFGYLAHRYGLTQIGISGINPDLDPSPARIAEIHRLARQYQVTTVFSEVLASPDMARAIAGDLGLRTDLLDPLEGITPDSRGTDYLSVMRSNLVALRTANGCS